MISQILFLPQYNVQFQARNTLQNIQIHVKHNLSCIESAILVYDVIQPHKKYRIILFTRYIIFWTQMKKFRI